MKKNYISPRVKTINLGSNKNLLQSSYVDIGGKTDEFNARPNYHGIWDNSEEE